MVITGVILIIPTAFRPPTSTSGFDGFIQSLWGFVAVAVITAALELIKSLVINPKAILDFEEIHNDNNVISAGRADTFFNQYVLNNYRNGKEIRICISHRLSSCRFCDEITVMDNGEIVERGNHDMLVSAGGHYSELWSAQAEYYKDTAGELFA